MYIFSQMLWQQKSLWEISFDSGAQKFSNPVGPMDQFNRGWKPKKGGQKIRTIPYSSAYEG